jgi:hypothetical protein
MQEVCSVFCQGGVTGRKKRSHVLLLLLLGVFNNASRTYTGWSIEKDYLKSRQNKKMMMST